LSALKALLQSLGPVETMRFLGIRRTGRLDSVQRHRRWQKTLEPQAFFNQVFGQKS
jgi:hypothetical protein